MRTVGVEEELLLVDESSGQPVPRASELLRGRNGGRLPGRELRGLVAELQEEQLETNSRPHVSLAALGAELVGWRHRADQLARQAEARVAALATSPLPVSPTLLRHGRYVRLRRLYRAFEEEQLTCGCHVHVSVESPAEGVGALDRIRVWLAPLLALTSNSPFWQGADTGYSSYRAQVWSRWPSAGPIDVQGSPESYHRLVGDLITSGAILDAGMVYFDARLSATYPTVEIRVADVCLHAEDAVVFAGLARALVDTAAQEWREGAEVPQVPTTLLRAAAWRAARWGLSGDLVHPVDWVPRPARLVIADLHEHVRPALQRHGDDALVGDGLERLFTRGNGAQRQRSVWAGQGSLSAVVRDAVECTHAVASPATG
ncbi:glutamate--cysteine ligase [Pedococcus bigeumensis]|uniref:glutamate--cysteine ligase n=1 Tax=Pedococcus bigeumensis TaxID=433644 RepID=UPI0031D7684B